MIRSRELAALLILCAGATAQTAPTATAVPKTQVVILGTGTPRLDPDRSGPAICIVANGTPYLVDFGPGVVRRAAAAALKGVTGCAPTKIKVAFATHLHSDHVVGFPDVWLTGWLVGPGRNRPLEVWGPPGTEKMLAHLVQAFEFDIKYRISDDKARPEGVVVNAHDINPGVSYEQNGVKITAIEVDHAPVEPSLWLSD